jgi:putative transposase
LNRTEVSRYNLENYCHSVTTKTYRNGTLFRDEAASELLIQVIYEVRAKLGFKLIGFVVMPDHVHLMVVPDKQNTISDVMRHIKGRFSRRLNELGRGMNSPDYEVPKHRAGNLSRPTSKVWQESFYDHVIRNRKEFDERLNYVHNNPVKAKFVEKPEEYQYFSATGKYEIDLDGYVGG